MLPATGTARRRGSAGIQTCQSLPRKLEGGEQGRIRARLADRAAKPAAPTTHGGVPAATTTARELIGADGEGSGVRLRDS